MLKFNLVVVAILASCIVPSDAQAGPANEPLSASDDEVITLIMKADVAIEEIEKKSARSKKVSKESQVESDTAEAGESEDCLGRSKLMELYHQEKVALVDKVDTIWIGPDSDNDLRKPLQKEEQETIKNDFFKDTFVGVGKSKGDLICYSDEKEAAQLVAVQKEIVEKREMKIREKLRQSLNLAKGDCQEAKKQMEGATHIDEEGKPTEKAPNVVCNIPDKDKIVELRTKLRGEIDDNGEFTKGKTYEEKKELLSLLDDKNGIEYRPLKVLPDGPRRKQKNEECETATCGGRKRAPASEKSE